jgi:DNA polymerase elongation subunit (family B)
MKIEFMPLKYEYFDILGKNFVSIIGRDSKGERACIVDEFEAFFWAILKPGLGKSKIEKINDKIKKIEVEKAGRKTKVERTEIHDKKYLGKNVKAIKIFVTNLKDAHDVADQMGWKEIIARREYDISLVTKYIMNKKIVPLTWYEVEGEKISGPDFGGIEEVADLCIKVEKAKKIDKTEFEPRILSFDIETTEFEIGKGEILMISMRGKDFKKVITWKHCSIKQDFVECLKDEAEMIESFIKYVHAYQPDILCGYFSDGFDLPYLKERAKKNNIKLSLGLDGSAPDFSRGRIPAGNIFGITHIDLFRFIETVYSQNLQSETLSMHSVASELIGEGKHEFDFSLLRKMNDEHWKDFFEYNMQDSCLTYKLAEKIWPDLSEFSRVIQEPLFDVSRDGMSSNVENYILHNLERFNEIAEKRPLNDEISKRRARQKYEGAFVFQPIPGLYDNLAIFDFTSMHASIIVTYNLSKSTLLEKKIAGSVESPELELEGKKTKFYFSKEPGFFSLLLKEIVELRKKYKKELKEKPDVIKKARSNAFKLLANAYYGYLGFFGARYYSVEAAASTLAFVRSFNKWTMDRANQEGYKVIFGDTDSVGFLLNKKTKEETEIFLKKLNDELPGIMELELEDFTKEESG